MIESTRRWSSYVPPLALMGLIFYLSSRSHLDSGLGDWDMVLRKLGHAGVFGTLALLWWRALGRGGKWPAVAITVAYAITDEIHQTFVPLRHGSPVDVLIDSAGAVVAVVLYARWRRRPRSGSSGWRSEPNAGASVVSGEDAGRSNSGAIGATEDKA